MFPFPSLVADCLSWLRTSVKRGRRPSPRCTNRAVLDLESLEDRVVPAVLFQPVFGAQQTNIVGSGEMNSPHVYPIFWGSYWTNHFAQADQIAAKFQQVAQFGSSQYDYLSGIKQYGSNGSAQIDGAHFDASTEPPATINPGFGNPTTKEIEKVLYNEPSGIPTPGQLGKTAIYVVVTPPNVSGGNNSGFNQPGFNPDLLHLDIREEIWVSSGNNGDGNLNLDQTTSTFSHELVEAMTDMWGPVPAIGGVVVSKGANYSGASGAQIGDNEPDAFNYQYRLGGPTGTIVQAYWSLKDQQYLVPDGNSLTMQINPDPWQNNRFSGGTLVIDANQPAPPGFAGHQSIDIDTAAIGGGTGVKVVMDGQTFVFEPNQITKIQLKTANDSETVAVHGSLGNVPMQFDLGTGHYVLKLDPSQQTNQLNGPLTVNTTAGGTLEVQLAPTGNLDYIHSNVTIQGSGSGSTVTFKLPASTNLIDDVTNAYSGKLLLNNGNVFYSNFDTVALRPFTGALGTLTLFDGGFANEQYTVSGAGLGSISMDGGTLKYSGFSEVEDLMETASTTFDFTGKSLFGSPPPVNILDGPHVIKQGFYDYKTTSLQQSFPFIIGPATAEVNFANKANVTVHGGAHDGTFNVNTSGYNDGLLTLKIDPGKGNTSVNIANTSAVPLTVTNSGGMFDVETVTLHDASKGVQGIVAAVDVENPKFGTGAETMLVVDDRGDNMPRSANLYGTFLEELTPQTLNWGGISGLTVDGDKSGNTYMVWDAPGVTTINTGEGDDKVTVNLFPASAVELHLHGGPGFDTLLVTTTFPNMVINNDGTQFTAHTPFFQGVSHIFYDDFENVSLDQPKGAPKPTGGPGGTGKPGSGSPPQWSQEFNNLFMMLIDLVATQQVQTRLNTPTTTTA